MVKLLKLLKPYRVTIGIILGFTLSSRLSELYLPTLMADIVNTGIIKGDTNYILKIGGSYAAGGLRWHGLRGGRRLFIPPRPQWVLAKFYAIRCLPRSQVSHCTSLIKSAPRPSLPGPPMILPRFKWSP